MADRKAPSKAPAPEEKPPPPPPPPRKFAVVDTDGRAVAFYDSETHGVRIPGEAFEISEAIYREWLAGQATLAWDAKEQGLVAAPHAARVSREMLRANRNRLLAASDWTQLPDSPLSQGQQLAWRNYRDALRNLFVGSPDPASVVFPEEPAR